MHTVSNYYVKFWRNSDITFNKYEMNFGENFFQCKNQMYLSKVLKKYCYYLSIVHEAPGGCAYERHNPRPDWVSFRNILMLVKLKKKFKWAV